MSYQCATCKRTDVRLYRIYGNFLRAAEIFCNSCIPDPVADRDWWVPLVEDADGAVWGHNSVPVTDWDRWRARPDADPAGPVWNYDGQPGWSDPGPEARRKTHNRHYPS